MSSIPECVNCARFRQNHWVISSRSDLSDFVIRRETCSLFSFHNFGKADDRNLTRLVLSMWNTCSRCAGIYKVARACLSVFPVAPSIQSLVTCKGKWVVTASSNHNYFFAGEKSYKTWLLYHLVVSMTKLSSIMLSLAATTPRPKLPSRFKG